MRLASLVARLRTRVELRHPPRCPDGWTVAPPDFIGLGAQRSGTTWLYSLIAAHPDVQGEATKELHYFHRYWGKPFTDADAQTYARYFPRPAGKIAGEWSPGYLSHFWVPPLVARAAPDAKLLVSLRDPVERYRSGVVLQAETKRIGAAGASTAFRLGCYGMQLEHLLSYVDRDRLHLVQFEDCTRDAGTQLARIYEFLGLDPTFRPAGIDRPVNAARAAKDDLSAETRAALVDAYTPDVRHLLTLDLGIDVSRWPNFAHLA
ncbi:MAG: sulfotransferase [Actinobacteria bacterium]|nr:sulfotransferase [Actinomycetota bacterium]